LVVAAQLRTMRTAIQLYTLRDLDRSLPDLLELVGDTDFDGVEFAGLDGTDPGTVVDVLAETDLSVAGAHVPFEELADDFEGTVETYRAVGCETLVVPLLEAEQFRSVDAVRETAERLDDLARRLLGQDLRLCYHNHDHEFVSLDGGDAFDLLVAETTDVAFELDVGWVRAAGRDPVALLADLSGRVPLVHLKDVDADPGEPTELGEGDLALDACARAGERAGAEWLIYEHDEPPDPEASLFHGAELLTSLQ
jgi:sugar phosphate isomerase/epimerase